MACLPSALCVQAVLTEAIMDGSRLFHDPDLQPAPQDDHGIPLYHLIHLGLEVLKVERSQEAQGAKVEGHNRRHTALWVRRPGGIAGLPRKHQTVDSCGPWGWVGMSKARGRRARAGQDGAISPRSKNRVGRAKKKQKQQAQTSSLVT